MIPDGFSLTALHLAATADPGPAVAWGGLALALVLALLVVRSHRRRPLRAAYLAFSRTLLLLLALFLIHRPELRLSVTREVKDRLLILLDDSASMSLPARQSDRATSRFAAAAARLAEFAPAADRKFETRTLRISDRPAQSGAADPPREGLTDLGAGLLYGAAPGEAGGDFRPDAILLLSDGRPTKGLTLDAAGLRLAAPVFAWPAGEPLNLSDLALDALVHEPEVYTGEEVPVRLYLRRRNVAADRVPCRLVDEAGRLLDEGIAAFEPGSAETTLTLRFRPDKPGETVIGADLPALPGEDVTLNNSRHTVVTVSRRDLKCLLVSTFPRFDALFVARTLAGRRGVGLRSLTCTGGRLIDAETGATLAGPPDLAETTLVILDQPDGKALGKPLLEAVATRVKAGAGLLVIGGERLDLTGTALEPLLPVVNPGGYRPNPAAWTLADAGLAHPVTQLSRSPEMNRLQFADLPPCAGLSTFERCRPGALALLTDGAGGPPLFAIGRAGAGKVATLLGDGLAALLFRPALLAKSRTQFETFLGRTVAHLAVTDDERFRIRVSRAVLAAGESVNAFIDAPSGGPVRLAAKDAAGQVVFAKSLAADAATRALREEFALERSGAYTLEASDGRATATARVFVEPPAEEFREVSPDVEGLRRLAGRTGGLLLDEASLRSAPRLIKSRHRTLKRDLTIPLYDFLPVFFLLLVILTVEWGVRKLWRLE